jgi:hypothetical protein
MPARHEEYITFGRWTLQAASVIYNISTLKVKYIIHPAVLTMYCESATFSFWIPTLTFWGLHIVLTKEMYKNMYCAVFLVQLLMGEGGKELLRNIT